MDSEINAKEFFSTLVSIALIVICIIVGIKIGHDAARVEIGRECWDNGRFEVSDRPEMKYICTPEVLTQ